MFSNTLSSSADLKMHRSFLSLFQPRDAGKLVFVERAVTFNLVTKGFLFVGRVNTDRSHKRVIADLFNYKCDVFMKTGTISAVCVLYKQNQVLTGRYL